MARKLFKCKVCSFFYEVIDEKWLDDDTYVMVCQDMIDVDVELKLDVLGDVTIGELSEWLEGLSVEVKDKSGNDKIKIIESVRV